MNTKYKLEKTACLEHYWMCLNHALSAAGGGTDSSKLQNMTMKEAADILAQNGIRFVFNVNDTISHVSPIDLLEIAIAQIDKLSKELEIANQSNPKQVDLISALQTDKYPLYLYRRSDGAIFYRNIHDGLYYNTDITKSISGISYSTAILSGLYTTNRVDKQ
jgi:hypothetical protein